MTLDGAIFHVCSNHLGIAFVGFHLLSTRDPGQGYGRWWDVIFRRENAIHREMKSAYFGKAGLRYQFKGFLATPQKTDKLLWTSRTCNDALGKSCWGNGSCCECTPQSSSGMSYQIDQTRAHTFSPASSAHHQSHPLSHIPEDPFPSLSHLQNSMQPST